MTCNKTVDSYYLDVSKEVTNITFYSDKTAEKEIIATLKNNNAIDSVINMLQQQYCNSNLDEGYKCSVSHKGNSIILKKSGERKEILEINRDVSILEYQKTFESMGFKCKG